VRCNQWSSCLGSDVTGRRTGSCGAGCGVPAARGGRATGGGQAARGGDPTASRAATGGRCAAGGVPPLATTPPALVLPPVAAELPARLVALPPLVATPPVLVVVPPASTLVPPLVATAPALVLPPLPAPPLWSHQGLRPRFRPSSRCRLFRLAAYRAGATCARARCPSRRAGGHPFLPRPCCAERTSCSGPRRLPASRAVPVSGGARAVCCGVGAALELAELQPAAPSRASAITATRARGARRMRSVVMENRLDGCMSSSPLR